MSTDYDQNHGESEELSNDVEIELVEDFDRLQWSIFEDVSNVRVLDDPDSSSSTVLPFCDHPLSKQSATKVPLREIAFTIDCLDTFEAHEYESPERWIVRRSDGGFATVGDVVEQLSTYFIAHKEEVLEAKAPLLQIHPAVDSAEEVPAHIKFFFEGFLGARISTGYYAIPVMVSAREEDPLRYQV